MGALCYSFVQAALIRKHAKMTFMKIKIIALLFFFAITALAETKQDKKVILFLGDSLTEGYGIDESKAYPVLVGQELKKDGINVEVLNGSVSGSTTASGVSRLRWFLKKKPDIMLLALGANDGLRGLKVKNSKENLSKIIALAKENEIKVVLAGMLMPPNYGASYRTEFEEMYKTLVKENKLEFIPFLLEGVAGVKELNTADGIHPNEKGHEVMAKLVTRKFKEIL